MTGSASNLTLKLVLHHDELKNMNHAVLRGGLGCRCKCIRDSNPIPLDRAQKVGP